MAGRGIAMDTFARGGRRARKTRKKKGRAKEKRKARQLVMYIHIYTILFMNKKITYKNLNNSNNY